MLFNSYSFIFLFLPIVFFGMFYLGRYSHRLAAAWLGLASLSFYAMWDARFVMLLIASIVFNYGAGYWIGLRRAANEYRQAKYSLAVAITLNLILLGYFKYTNFFIESLTPLFGLHFPALDIILPLGISFFTFTQIAFLMDVHRGIAREYNFVHYLLFVTYFPHLIAGPVLHHKQMMPQFSNPAAYRMNAEHIAVGITIFVLGLSKKVLIADNLAVYATPIFNAVRDGAILTLLETWIGALAYTLQIYFDFSGYSDMAIGLSLMFNIRLPINFDSPYKAISIIDFWRRWHITLSSFLRDYLYVPLGGNRHGKTRRYMNLTITMLLGGLWHGAGWTFIVWGGLHGLYLMVNHAWREIKARLGWRNGGAVANLAGGALTFVAVVIAWVFFRADNFAAAQSMLASMFGAHALMPEAWVPSREALKMIIPSLALVWTLPNVRQMLIRHKPTWEDMAGVKTPSSAPPGRPATRLAWKIDAMHAIALALLFIYCVNSLTKVSEFLYFRF
ncbi:MAG TPA: MBOAT family protein [Burkholderiaceae bacterium]|nr:MBOAT family protein [Burkholderiaceae bacterium]